MEKCLPLLTETVEDLNAAYVRSADAQDCIEHNSANVSFLEDQLQSLQRKLASRKREKTTLDAEIETLERTVEFGIQITPGLCIRMLNKTQLSHVLSYLNPLGGINKVCTLWKEIAEIQRHNNVTTPLLSNSGVNNHILKRCKSEIRSELAQIRVNVMLRELTHKQKTAAAEVLKDMSGHNHSGGSNPNSPLRGGALTGTGTPAALSGVSLSAASNVTATTTTAAQTAGAGVTTTATSTVTGAAEGSRAAVQGKYSFYALCWYCGL